MCRMAPSEGAGQHGPLQVSWSIASFVFAALLMELYAWHGASKDTQDNVACHTCDGI